jgi:DNA invertase Pin-like site-specific DNA recombinase
MRVVQYARVSDPSTQDTDDKVSIQQQLADMRALCERKGWQIAGEYVDNESYKATQNPNRGKVVNPSGERADRPQFLKMLEVVKTGDAGIVLCWRDDRLVRHPRVAVALEDALDLGDANRNGKPKIEIRDATGALIDRFTLSIKATIWREENKRRAERVRMGKVATLQQGGWPGSYNRLGYTTRRSPGQRGRAIELADDDEVQLVQDIFNWYDSGLTVGDIRQKLRTSSARQKGNGSSVRRWEWNKAVIGELLRAEDYTGKATWCFADGEASSIEIPPIIPVDLWKRVQERLDRNKQLATRNAGGVYLLQNILYCGECGGKVSAVAIRYFHKTMADGKRKRYEYKNPPHQYRCVIASKYPDEHPHPKTWWGPALDYAVWRRLVDYGIERPDLITSYILDRQAELQAQGDSVGSEIAHARRRLAEIGQERAFYQRQAARGKMTEAEFDARMEETEEAHQHWEAELERFQELRDNTERVRAGLDYATQLLTALQGRLAEIDIPPGELKALPEEKRKEILKARQEIIRALCDKVVVYADRRIVIEGALDGSESAQFELGSS